MKKVAIGVDIGGSHILSKAVDITTGEILHHTEGHLKLNGKASKNEILSNWASTINKTLHLSSSFDISGIGFAMPGAFNYAEGIALFAEGNDKYHSLYGLKISDCIKPILSVPDIPLRFHNDASCFAIGEDRYGMAQDHKRSISITLGTGFGSSFIDDGIPIIVTEDVPEDGCLWRLNFKNGIGDEYFSSRWFVKTFEEDLGEKLAGVKEIVERRKTDPSVQMIFESFGANLAEFLCPWIKRFRPSLLVLGGNIANSYPLFSDSLQNGLNQLDLKMAIAVSHLKEDAAILGSARLLDDAYFTKIKDSLPTK